MSRDPRLDDYIAKAAPFARPILEKVRERVHAAAPQAEETLKWNMPSFTIDGKILLGMAAFKAHAAPSGAVRSLAKNCRGPGRWASSGG